MLQPSSPLTTAMFVSQESWASDVGVVRDYMCSYLKESSNEASDPSFQLDEVGGPTPSPPGSPRQHQALTSLLLPLSSSHTSSPRKTW